jgi:hypothetical protein
MKLLAKTLRAIYNSMSVDLDHAFTEIEEVSARNAELSARAEKAESEVEQLVEMLGTEKDARIEDQEAWTEQASDVVRRALADKQTAEENESLARKTVVEMQKKLDAVTANIGEEQMSTAVQFLASAEKDPVGVAMTLLYTPIHRGFPLKHGHQEPRAFVAQKMLDDLACAAWRQARWNEQTVANARERLITETTDPEGRELGTDEINLSRQKFLEEKVVIAERQLEYWQDLFKTACEHLEDRIGYVWSINDHKWLLKKREATPEVRPEATPEARLDAETGHVSVTDL